MHAPPAAYVLSGAAVLALAYSAWLIAAVLAAIAAGGEAGNGVFVLVYAALPSAVALISSVRLLASDRPWVRLGTVVTTSTCLLALVQITWLIGLASRAAREPLFLALATTAVVIAAAVANLRTTARRRLTAAPGPG